MELKIQKCKVKFVGGYLDRCRPQVDNLDAGLVEVADVARGDPGAVLGGDGGEQ